MSNELTTLSTLEEEIILQGFESVFLHCKYKGSSAFDVVFSSMFGFNDCNFKGGCGDDRRTIHENMFAIMFPNFEQQVVFGTGKGGMKKFGCKKYTADFYDIDEGYIFEIDGYSHHSKLEKLKDEIRDLFFQSIGITVLRLKNKKVESMMINHLREVFKRIGQDSFVEMSQEFRKQAIKS